MSGKSDKRKKNVDETSSKTSIRILSARSAVFVYLVIACIVCGWGAHYSFSQYENELRFAGYESIVDELAAATVASLRRNKLSTQMLSNAFSAYCPNASTWPNCSIPLSYYKTVTDPIMDSANMRTLSMNPILTKDQVAPFEEFAYNFFEAEGYGAPINLGVRSFGKGIYGVNNSNGRQEYHTVDEYQGGANPIFIPIFLAGRLGTNSDAVMYNMYSQLARAAAVDDLITCVGSVDNCIECGSISDFLYLVADEVFRPASLIFHPIFPYDNNDTLVGLSVAALNWGSLLQNHLPGSVADIDVVIASESTQYTFTVQGAGVVLKGEGDLHDTSFSGRRVTVPLTEYPHSSVSYSLSIYPTAAFASQSSTSYPIYASVVAVLVIILTTLVVFMYDFSVLREVREREVVMETKRLFVRYISHEIRTPLNTIHLGLVVLMGEMERVIDDVMALRLQTKNEEVKRSTSPRQGGRQFKRQPSRGLISEAKGGIEFKSDADSRHCRTHTDPGGDVQLATFAIQSCSSKESRTSLMDENGPSVTMTQDTNSNEGAREKIVADISSWIDLINEIEESSDVAVTVLNDLINYDKIVGGLLKMDLSEVFLWPLILSTIKPFNLQAKEKNIKIKMYNNCSEEDAQKLIVIADSVKISQVVRNLVSNALKFTPREGIVSITVEWVNTDELHTNLGTMENRCDDPMDFAKFRLVGNMRLSVKDSGVGMSSSNLEQLFQEGVQFNPNQLQGGQGSGLGLWVSKGFVVRHGGTLTATSEGIGKGSTFSMQLPVFVVGDTSGFELKEPEVDSTALNKRGRFFPGSPSSLLGRLIPGTSLQADSGANASHRYNTVDLSVGGVGDDDPLDLSRHSNKSLSHNSCSHNSKSQSKSQSKSHKSQGGRIASNVDVEFGAGDPEVADFHNEIENMGCDSNDVNDVSHLVSDSAARKSSPESLVKAVLRSRSVDQTSGSISLPINGQDTPQPQPTDSNLHSLKYEEDAKTIKTILVVDDAGSNRKILCRLLKNGGYEVYEAEDGHNCVDMVAKTLSGKGSAASSSSVLYDLILMDFQMPVMNGPVAAKKLRELGYSAPIIGITGNVLDSDMSDFVANGATAVMRKPIQFNDLNKRIRDLEASGAGRSIE